MGETNRLKEAMDLLEALSQGNCMCDESVGAICQLCELKDAARAIHLFKEKADAVAVKAEELRAEVHKILLAGNYENLRPLAFALQGTLNKYTKFSGNDLGVRFAIGGGAGDFTHGPFLTLEDAAEHEPNDTSHGIYQLSGDPDKNVRLKCHWNVNKWIMWNGYNWVGVIDNARDSG